MSRGRRPHGYRGPACATPGRFLGQSDKLGKYAGAEKIKAAVKVPMELPVYDAQHAFCNDRRPDVYNAEAAKQAWDHALAFLRSHTR